MTRIALFQESSSRAERLEVTMKSCSTTKDLRCGKEGELKDPRTWLTK